MTDIINHLYQYKNGQEKADQLEKELEIAIKLTLSDHHYRYIEVDLNPTNMPANGRLWSKIESDLVPTMNTGYVLMQFLPSYCMIRTKSVWLIYLNWRETLLLVNYVIRNSPCKDWVENSNRPSNLHYYYSENGSLYKIEDLLSIMTTSESKL